MREIEKLADMLLLTELLGETLRLAKDEALHVRLLEMVAADDKETLTESVCDILPERVL